MLDEFLRDQFFGTRGQVVGVVPIVTFEDPISQLDDPGGELVEEMAVVGDDEDGAGAL